MVDRKVRQKMNHDPFAPPSKKKLLVYSWIGASLLVAGVVLFIAIGVPPLRAALFFLGMGGFFAGAIWGYLWLCGGKRTEVAVGPAGVKPPARLMKALPYMIGVIALLYLLKIIETFASR